MDGDVSFYDVRPDSASQARRANLFRDRRAWFRAQRDSNQKILSGVASPEGVFDLDAGYESRWIRYGPLDAPEDQFLVDNRRDVGTRG